MKWDTDVMEKQVHMAYVCTAFKHLQRNKNNICILYDTYLSHGVCVCFYPCQVGRERARLWVQVGASGKGHSEKFHMRENFVCAVGY